MVTELRSARRTTSIGGDDAPLWRTAKGKTKTLTANGMKGKDVLRLVKRRFKEAGLPANVLTCHTFRATTITDLLEQGVPLEECSTSPPTPTREPRGSTTGGNAR